MLLNCGAVQDLWSIVRTSLIISPAHAGSPVDRDLCTSRGRPYFCWRIARSQRAARNCFRECRGTWQLEFRLKLIEIAKNAGNPTLHLKQTGVHCSGLLRCGWSEVGGGPSYYTYNPSLSAFHFPVQHCEHLRAPRHERMQHTPFC